MSNNQNIHDIKEKALAAGLSADTLAEAAAHLCKLRGLSPDDLPAIAAAIEDITKFRQIEMAIETAHL